jgi:SAM-dependent methyltransferase
MKNNIKYEQSKIECSICRSTTSYIFTSKNNKDIFKCNNILCGHNLTPIFKTDQGFNLRGNALEKESDADLKEFEKRNESLLKIFINYLKDTPKPFKFLDFGTGSAHVSRTFKKNLKNDCVIYAIEENTLFKDLYSKYDLIQIKNLDNLPEKVDLIYMIEVLEHVVDPVAILKKLYKSLKSNGTLFISTPLGTNNENFSNAYVEKSHLHFFTKKSLNLALKKSRFTEIKYKFYSQMYPRPVNSNILIQGIYSVKLLLQILINKMMPTTSIKHLVGFSKPLL